MANILAFDPGTNSLGMVHRDTTKGTLVEQITTGVDIMRDNSPSDSKGRHHSAASQRRGFRNTRTRYLSVKRRKQATLKLLISKKCCPLDMESLNKWRFDDDEKGYDRTFPVENSEFMNWVNFRFVINGEVVKSVYRLREILVTTPLDYKKPESWMMLGRAIYSIAVRRGFKSSRLSNVEPDDNKDIEDVQLQESEEALSKGLFKYMNEHQCLTAGAAFSRMERVDKIRIRANDDYKVVRSMLKDEIKKIFEVQGLDMEGDLYIGLMSEKKHEGTIFYKNPLKSQKGKVEYCTLEPKRRRCPSSHPANELNVAWQLLNNIKIKILDSWEDLELNIKKALFANLFIRNKKHFDFKEIREWLEKEFGISLRYKESINYNDNKSIPGCPVRYYLKKILGDNWEQEKIQGNRKHLTHSQRRQKADVNEQGHITEYDAEDIWHICYESDEKQFVKDFAKNVLGLAPSKVISMGALWEVIKDDYSKLSLCSIKKINPFLLKGYKYPDAVMLANLPQIMGKAFFEEHEKNVIKLIEEEKASITQQNKEYDIANKLISDYKSLQLEELAFAEHNYDYTLQEDDVIAVCEACKEYYGQEWTSFTEENRESVVTRIGELYQDFFFSKKRDYYKKVRLTEAVKNRLLSEFHFLTKEKLGILYHHSNNEYYPQAVPDEKGVVKLGSPAKSGLNNPDVLKVLYKIKENVNRLLESGTIDTDAIIVVENARELNDYNMRWAIEEYDRKREKENKTIEDALDSLASELSLTLPKDCVSKARLALYQNENFTPYNPNESRKFYDKLFEKYKFWLRQGFVDFYTGRPITLSELFSDQNLVEIDHILPISKSFDNSISNKVLSSTAYNKKKRTKLPCELDNYYVDTEDGTAIINRINELKEKVRYLEDKVNYWKSRSSRAADPDSRNHAIKQMHLWRMEYEEWSKRVVCLTTKEITPGFRNSQLNDTRIITKYAYHYLKSVFGRVVMQRGETTAVFRKIFGFQEAYEKKDRSKHTHHAIDALTLSLIPFGAKRERMMELFYMKEEAHRFEDYTLEKELEEKLNREVVLCGVGKYSPDEIVKYIEETTLVKNDSTNRCLTKSIKRYRVRGKVVPLRDENGNVIYEQTSKGKRVKAKHVSQGDSIRGAIHGQTFYGKIKKWKDGSHEIEEKFVLRRKIEFKAGNQGSGFKSWDDLESKMVDKKLFKKFKAQYPDGTPFKDACAGGFYTHIKEDGVWRKVKVRHVRCIEKGAQQLKKHIFQPQYSDDEKYYYVSPGDSYGIFEYVSEDGNSIKYIAENLFTLSNKMKEGVLKEKPCPSTIEVRGIRFNHTRTILKEDTILIYPSTESRANQFKLDRTTISERLYRINSVELDRRLNLTRHNLAMSYTGRDSIDDNDFGNLPDGMRMSISKLNFLLLGTDFEIVNGEIMEL